jgi:hypothetical protein
MKAAINIEAVKTITHHKLTDPLRKMREFLLPTGGYDNFFCYLKNFGLLLHIHFYSCSVIYS